MQTALYNLEFIDLLVSGPATGTIAAPQTVGFKAVTGTATILTNQAMVAGDSINFPELQNKQPLPDIDYSVDAASTLQILGYRHVAA